GPFTSVGVINTSLSYRLRAYGRIDHRLTLDAGIDVLSRATRYDALVPVDDNLFNSQGVDITPSQILRGASTLGLGFYGVLGIDLGPRWKLVPSARFDTYLIDGQDRF